MNSVTISAALIARIEEAARRAYPDEACGFLCSDLEGTDATIRTIRTVEPAANEVDGARRRRFVISAGELRAAEQRAAGRAEAVSGFYHSHPDHPAVPSEFDTAHAWPWYAYLVTSVDQRGDCRTGAFELDPDGGRFVERRLDLARTDPSTEPIRATATVG